MPRPPIFAWSGKPYEFERKTAEWYWAVGIIAAALAIASILFGNILLAILIAVAAVALMLQAAKLPRIHRFAITTEGLFIDDRLYPYDTMLHYSVLEYVDHDLPPALSIKTRSFLSPHLFVPLHNIDADEVYEYLSVHLDEGNHETSAVDRLVEMFEL